MTPESEAFLNQHRHHYDLWKRARYVQHLDIATRQGLLDVIRKEFDPGYLADLWCNTCVVTLLEFAYTQYDKWLADQGQRILPMTFPKQ